MPPQIYFGSASIGSKFSTLPTVHSLLSTLTTLGITHLDTAARYGGSYGSGSTIGAPGDSEILLGQASAAQNGFTIDSKILFLGNGEGELTEQKIETSTLRTLERLHVQKLHTLYIHAPDGRTPLEEQAAGMDAQFRAGRTERVGISNFTAEMLREFIAICRKRGFVLPSVYQGQYNLLRREAEESLLPLLREEGMAFVAYSPLATGLLTVGEGKKGSVLLNKLYGGEKIKGALERFKKALAPLGVEATEAALRWAVYHSELGDGDALIIGASREEQVVDSMRIVRKGPLDEEVVRVVEQVWEDVRQG